MGALVSLEMGKILSEGIGEVQEFIDIVSSTRIAMGELIWPTVRLCSRIVPYDEWTSHCIREARSFDTGRWE